jgi:hypothetical protein
MVNREDVSTIPFLDYIEITGQVLHDWLDFKGFFHYLPHEVKLTTRLPTSIDIRILNSKAMNHSIIDS